MLGAFLFSGDDVDKKVKVLSGGERARLALCCMLLRPLNFLLLDEPTHHLDIQSKDVLKEAMKNYDGTFLLVSHDRDFLHGLTNRLLELDGGRIRDQHMDVLELIEKRKAMQGASVGASSKPMEKVSTPKNDYHQRKEREKERRRVENQVQRLEQKLAELEKQEKTAQAALAANGSNAKAMEAGYAELGDLAQRIAATMEEWERASEKLHELNDHEA
jgi:ATP-binding cassette subfamily F protein 3